MQILHAILYETKAYLSILNVFSVCYVKHYDKMQLWEERVVLSYTSR